MKSVQYDSFNSYFNYSGTVSNSINIYDYSRSSYLGGTKDSIYDYGTNTYITLKVQGGKFSGYDYETASYYSGTINGSNSISFYDQSDGSYYNFTF